MACRDAQAAAAAGRFGSISMTFRSIIPPETSRPLHIVREHSMALTAPCWKYNKREFPFHFSSDTNQPLLSHTYEQLIIHVESKDGMEEDYRSTRKRRRQRARQRCQWQRRACGRAEPECMPDEELLHDRRPFKAFGDTTRQDAVRAHARAVCVADRRAIAEEP